MKNQKIVCLPALVTILFSGCAATSLPQTEQISEEEAKQIALDQIPGATMEHIRKFETDLENGRTVYDGEIHYEQQEYDFEIDALDGTILDWDVEALHDNNM